MHSCVVEMYFVIISAVITHSDGDVFQCDNFQMDQEGMKKQLAQIHKLMQYTDPELCNYLGRPYVFVIVQMVLIGCISRSRGQKIGFQNAIFKILLV